MRGEICIDSFRPLPPIASIVASPLLRHLAAVQIWQSGGSGTPLGNASLAILAQHAPHLTSLWCRLNLTPTEPLVLPAKLQSLELQLFDQYSDASINSLLATLAALPSLARLRLELSALAKETSVELRILAACPTLTDLTLDGLHGGTPKLSDAQWEQIRSSLGHLQRCDVGPVKSDELARS